MTSRKQQYLAYLQSDHWRSLRNQALLNAGGKCEFCQTVNFLKGHHLRYRNLTDCTAEDVMILCNSCHCRWHEKHNSRYIAKREWVLRFLAGIVDYRARPHKLTKKQRRVYRMLKRRSKRR